MASGWDDGSSKRERVGGFTIEKEREREEEREV